jgi:CDP-glucose 4,6-dehydratase
MADLVRSSFGGQFEGRRVLVTGDTGFKGSWLAIWLSRLGAQVWGYAIEAPSDPANFHLSHVERFINHIHGDLRDQRRLREVVGKVAPEIVFHLAAQPLVRASYADPLATFDVNVLGSCRLLEALRELRVPVAVVMVTSDKCYENREWTFGYRENDPLGGHDPYSASKAAMEIAVAAWRRSFCGNGAGLKIASVRAGNVIGGGDWGIDRLVTDCVRAWCNQQPASLRSPRAVRPWQHVLEPLSGYLWLGSRLLNDDGDTFANAWNFGPGPEGSRTVGELADTLFRELGGGSWTDESRGDNPHEAGVLRLICDRANHELGWFPTLEFDEMVKRTAAWYRDWRSGRHADMSARCLEDIEWYTDRARTRGRLWCQ